MALRIGYHILENQGKIPEGIVTLLRQNGFTYLIYNDGLLNFIVNAHDNTYLASFLPAFRQFMARWLLLVSDFSEYQVYQIPGA